MHKTIRLALLATLAFVLTGLCLAQTPRLPRRFPRNARAVRCVKYCGSIGMRARQITGLCYCFPAVVAGGGGCGYYGCGGCGYYGCGGFGCGYYGCGGYGCGGYGGCGGDGGGCGGGCGGGGCGGC
jgi:hypothetical protein